MVRIPVVFVWCACLLGYKNNLIILYSLSSLPWKWLHDLIMDFIQMLLSLNSKGLGSHLHVKSSCWNWFQSPMSDMKGWWGAHPQVIVWSQLDLTDAGSHFKWTMGLQPYGVVVFSLWEYWTRRSCWWRAAGDRLHTSSFSLRSQLLFPH